MPNKKKFEEMILELKEVNNYNGESNNPLIRLFPVRNNMLNLKHSIKEVLRDIKIDMISIITGHNKLDIYQEYFEDYDIDNNILTVNFKYNKQKKIKLFN